MSKYDLSDEKMRELLSQLDIPEADEAIKNVHLHRAEQAFEASLQKNEKNFQGFSEERRPIHTTLTKWIGELTMKKIYVTTGAVTMCVLGVGLTQFHKDSLNSYLGQNEAPHTIRTDKHYPESKQAVKTKKESSALPQEMRSRSNNEPVAVLSKPTGKDDRVIAELEVAEEVVMGDMAASAPPATAGLVAPNVSSSSGGMVGRMAKRAPQIQMQDAYQGGASFQHSAPQTSIIRPGQTMDRIIVPERPNRDQFEKIEDNPLKVVSTDPVSTFSIDVDTASYSFVRRSLNQGRLPNPNAVRVEEMINYFDYDYALPETKAEPFKPTVAVYPTPWNEDTQLMHIGIKGYDIEAAEKPRSNLVFLIDTSGSMGAEDKLPLLVNAFKMMVGNLHPEDTVAIVTYAGSAGTALEPTKVSEKHTIISALENLRSGGSTAGAAGIEQAYRLAEANRDGEAVNRVILATDGDFNVGISHPDQLKKFIEKKRKSGIFLSVLGFGQGNYNDHLMQSLAQNGNGIAAYIDTLNEGRKVLVEEASSTLFAIAKDVKIQVEFNSARIAEYRLVGYQTRKLKREDFNNDKVDAGELGAGHSVTAIYEITPVGSAAQKVDPLRYGEKKEAERQAPISNQGELAFLKLRYKLPNGSKSTLMTRPITDADVKDSINATSQDIRFAASVAAFGEKLRGVTYLQDYDYGAMIKLATSGKGSDTFGYRAELINLMRLAQSLDTQ